MAGCGGPRAPRAHPRAAQRGEGAADRVPPRQRPAGPRRHRKPCWPCRAPAVPCPGRALPVAAGSRSPPLATCSARRRSGSDRAVPAPPRAGAAGAVAAATRGHGHGGPQAAGQTRPRWEPWLCSEPPRAGLPRWPSEPLRPPLPAAHPAPPLQAGSRGCARPTAHPKPPLSPRTTRPRVFQLMGVVLLLLS